MSRISLKFIEQSILFQKISYPLLNEDLIVEKEPHVSEEQKL